jgi:hypothetical protein
MEFNEDDAESHSDKDVTNVWLMPANIGRQVLWCPMSCDSSHQRLVDNIRGKFHWWAPFPSAPFPWHSGTMAGYRGRSPSFSIVLVFLSTRRTAWYMWGYATLNTWNQSDELRVQFSNWTWLCISGHPRNCRPYFIHMLQVWEWHTIWSYTLIV